MPRRLVTALQAACVAALTLLAMRAEVRADPLPAPVLARVISLTEGFMSRLALGGSGPALSLSICWGGEVVLARGFGEAAPGIMADAETLYHVGSVTKQFTAAAVLDQIARGARIPRTGTPLTLDTELSDIFDGVETWSRPDQPPITVRRLITMRSNLPNITRRPPPGSDPWGSIPAPELLAKVKRLAPHGWPDTFEYSNTSYFLLSEVLDTLLGAPGATETGYRTWMAKSLFPRAKLTATGFVGETPGGHSLALPIFRRKPAFSAPDWLKGSGDMVSNVLDIARWNVALLSGRVLEPRELELMFSDGARIGPNEWYGMGWFIEHKEDREVYSHSGTVPGYTSFNAIVRMKSQPTWLSVTLLTNVDNLSEIDQLSLQIMDAILVE